MSPDPIRVLYVEDASYGPTIASGLRKKGLEVIHCADPEEGQQALEQNKIDVVVSDINFEYTDSAVSSETFLKACAQRRIGIVIFSGSIYEKMEGVDEFVLLEKPATSKKVHQAIQQAHEKSKARTTAATIDDATLERIANPPRHIEVPIERWMQGLAHEKERDALLVVYRHYVGKEMAKAAKEGNWPRRHLDRLMRMYMVR
ncbi:hypothetical protein HY988_05315 [Candidatus Micrarchaeota archaeon]|nr:hypothetical protein [Candidatus Micrarchaeota archaeon]